MPPAASTGVGATASTTSGTRTMVEISPVWPPASVPWATIRSTPAAWWRSAWVRGAGQGGDEHVLARWARSIRAGGGGPRALATRRIGWAKATSSSGS